MDVPEKLKCSYMVIDAFAVVILLVMMNRWWNCDCMNRSNYEDVRNLPVYQGNKVVNGLIGNAQRMSGKFV